MEQHLRRARLATFAYFTLNGFLLGMWVVHIPAVEQRVGIGHALLGWLLLLLGGGAFVGMQIVGPLSDRLGVRTVVPLSAALCSVAAVLPGLAVDAWTLGAALFAFGLGNGFLDVSMNAHAVQVERGYGRPVMSAFHATFSVGGVIAAVIGARTLGLGWSPAATLTATAVLGLAAAAAAAGGLLRPGPVGPVGPVGPEHPEASEAAAGPVRTPVRTPGRIWLLAVLALMLMLCEGVANDWSVLHLQDVLGAAPATAALAYGGYSTAMTAGRLVADRVAARIGPAALLRYGAALASAGLTLAALSDRVVPALAGWALFGIGVSGCIPQLFSAAGHADPAAAGANVSRVAGLGYLGMLAGPAIIGPLTRVAPLNLVLLLPAALCLAAACTAGVLRRGPGLPSAVTAGAGAGAGAA